MRKEEFVPVSLRMRADLVDELDELKWKNRSDRSKEILRACEFLVKAVECPQCGTLNAQNSVVCSVCKTDLVKYKESLYWLAADKVREKLEKEIDHDDTIDFVVCRHPSRGFSIAMIRDFEQDSQETIKFIKISEDEIQKILNEIPTDELKCNKYYS